jgi:hypothetical protein
VFPVWEWKVGWSVSGLRHWAGMGISCSLLAGLKIEEEGDADGSGEEHGAFLCITQVLNSSCSSQESFGIRCCRMTALLTLAPIRVSGLTCVNTVQANANSWRGFRVRFVIYRSTAQKS